VRLVLDTNVFVSGVFFGGAPGIRVLRPRAFVDEDLREG